MTLPRSSVQATHIISRTHPKLLKGRQLLKASAHDSLSEYELLQTTNPIVQIHPSRVLSASWYERAKVCSASKKVLPSFLLPNVGDDQSSSEAQFQGLEKIYFVGSWAAEGLPLLEGCVVSAERLVGALAKREGAVTSIPY